MGVSRAHVYNLIKAGELSYYKDGSRTLILVANIEARIKRLSSGPPPTKPLLPVEQQQIAIERAGEPDYVAIYAERLKIAAPRAGNLNAWLHDDCAAPWREARRIAAVSELAAARVVRP